MINRRSFLMGSAAVTAAGVAETADKKFWTAPSGQIRDLGKLRELPPGRYDEHIHIYEDVDPQPEKFLARIKEAGLAGGCVYSREQAPEPRFGNTTRLTPEQIVDNVIGWCSASPTLYPFYWIDPARPDSSELVDMAVEKGIYGFKVIRSSGYPCDGYALDCYRRMAHWGKPVTFHTGILYDGMPSSEYFRPVVFEPLVKVNRLRFAMAHISWPWCEECVALSGKMNDAAGRCLLRGDRRKSDTRKWQDGAQMFVDATPGAHGIFRRRAFEMVFKMIFPIRDSIMFGSDCDVHSYNVKYCRGIMDTDDAFFKEFEVEPERIEKYYRGTLQRYLFSERT